MWFRVSLNVNLRRKAGLRFTCLLKYWIKCNKIENKKNVGTAQNFEGCRVRTYYLFVLNKSGVAGEKNVMREYQNLDFRNVMIISMQLVMWAEWSAIFGNPVYRTWTSYWPGLFTAVFRSIISKRYCSKSYELNTEKNDSITNMAIRLVFCFQKHLLKKRTKVMAFHCLKAYTHDRTTTKWTLKYRHRQNF